LQGNGVGFPSVILCRNRLC